MTLPRPVLVASLARGHPPDYPDVDNRACQLLGPTALVVQSLMGIGVIATLLYKRQREKPRRKWRVWVFDVSKQIAGQIIVHFSNIGISDWISHVAVKNPCVTYFLNILVDTTVGTCSLPRFPKSFRKSKAGVGAARHVRAAVADATRTAFWFIYRSRPYLRITMGQYESADRLFQVAWVQIRPVWRWA